MSVQGRKHQKENMNGEEEKKKQKNKTKQKNQNRVTEVCDLCQGTCLQRDHIPDKSEWRACSQPKTKGVSKKETKTYPDPQIQATDIMIPAVGSHVKPLKKV